MAAIFTANEFGESVTYTPADPLITPFSCVAIFEASESIDAIGGRVYRDMLTCRILQSALDGGSVSVPTPQRGGSGGDTITRDGVVWAIVDDPPTEFDSFCGVWTLTLEKDVRFIP